MLCALALTALTATDVHAIHPEDRVTDWFKVRVTADAALPDGIAVGASLAPLPHVRIHAAALTNVIGFGARGGLQLVPFSDWVLHPIFSCDIGRYFTGRPITYDFGTLNAGLELKVMRFELALLAGVSKVWTRGDYVLEATLPSAKLALGVRLN